MITSIIIIALYLLPTVVAYKRKHNNGGPIFIVNILLGWTFIFWVVALAWSTSDNTRK